MPFEYSENIEALLSNAIDNPVRFQKDFSKIITTELGYSASGEGSCACLARYCQKLADPAFCRNGVVPSDVVANRLEV